MVEFILRQATQNDAASIRSLIHSVHINPTGLDWERFLLAVTPDGELLGCGQIKLHGDGSRELASIAVQEYTRGRGVARAVIESLLERESTRPLHLMCRARLKSLYEKFGFHAIPVNEMPSYFRHISRVERLFNSKGKPEDRLAVMRLD